MLETNRPNDVFRLQCRHSKGNLHIRASGVFDGDSARTLLKLLREQYRGAGRVFVDTSELSEIIPLGSAEFRTRLGDAAVPAGNLFFKGQKGFALAPNGSKVLIISAKKKKSGCCGKCGGGCACGGHCHCH